MSNPNVCVLNAPGINCNEETAYAFAMFGANTAQVHISELNAGDRKLSDFQILALSGGFSDSDAIQAGRTLGLELSVRLGDDLNRFVAAGGLVIGICNGFQILTESGLLPDGVIAPGQTKKLSLVRNVDGKFTDDWQHLLTAESRCLFAQPADIGELIELPRANGEGRLVAKDTKAMMAALSSAGQVVFRYTSSDALTGDFSPDYPNTSDFGVTGVCDPSGQVLGLMPHPERFVETRQHPNWRRGEGQVPHGGLIIKQMVKVARAM